MMCSFRHMSTPSPEPAAQTKAVQPLPAGALSRIRTSRKHDLGHVDLHSLLIEVWERLERGETPTETGGMTSLGDAVSERLAECVDVHDNRFSRRRFRDLFGAFHRFLAEPRPPIAGATYLDLGCGSVNPLGMSLLMCMLGATRAIGVDLDIVQDIPRAARGLARLAEAMLQNPDQIVVGYPITRDQIARNLQGINLDALRAGDPTGIGTRLSMLRESASKLSLADGSIDVVMSNSFLEHVDDVDSIVAEMARVMVTGGFGIHNIDGSDHQSYVDQSLHPLDCLRQPGTGMLHGTNRIRPLQYPAIFERHGFIVQQTRTLKTVPLTPAQIAGFAAPWSTMPREMLETAVGMIVTRKK